MLIQISPTSNKLYSLISIEKFAIKFQIEFMKFKNERTKSRKQQKGEYPNSNFWKVWTVCANFYWNRLRNKVFIQEYIIFWNIINKQRNKIFPNFWQFFNFLTTKNLPSGLLLMNGSFCLKFHHNSIKNKGFNNHNVDLHSGQVLSICSSAFCHQKSAICLFFHGFE